LLLTFAAPFHPPETTITAGNEAPYGLGLGATFTDLLSQPFLC
jgi:hypothetical protein